MVLILNRLAKYISKTTCRILTVVSLVYKHLFFLFNEAISTEEVKTVVAYLEMLYLTLADIAYNGYTAMTGSSETFPSYFIQSVPFKTLLDKNHVLRHNYVRSSPPFRVILLSNLHRDTQMKVTPAARPLLTAVACKLFRC